MQKFIHVAWLEHGLLNNHKMHFLHFGNHISWSFLNYFSSAASSLSNFISSVLFTFSLHPFFRCWQVSFLHSSFLISHLPVHYFRSNVKLRIPPTSFFLCNLPLSTTSLFSSNVFRNFSMFHAFSLQILCYSSCYLFKYNNGGLVFFNLIDT